MEPLMKSTFTNRGEVEISSSSSLNCDGVHYNSNVEASTSSVCSLEEDDMLIDISDDEDRLYNICLDDDNSSVESGVVRCKKKGTTDIKEVQKKLSLSTRLSSNHTTVSSGSSSKCSKIHLKSSHKFSVESCRQEQRWCQKNVSGAFAELRKLVPTYPVDRKLNKNEILRMTIHYIHLLSSVREWQEKNAEKTIPM